MNGRAWTDRGLALLRELYPNTKTSLIARRLRRKLQQVYQKARKLGLAKSEAYLASPAACRLRRGDNVGAPYRFKKGHVPANKGLRRPGWFTGRMRETQFKKGQRPVNKMEIGELRLNADGYVDMKVREAKGALAWRGLHIEIWEDAHGPVPPGHCLRFRDGDKLNVCLENLQLISLADNCRRNSLHNLPKPLRSAIQMRAALVRSINRKERRHGANA